MSNSFETPAIISRAEAKAHRLMHYFTGKPCKRGHIAKRQLNGTCVMCAPEYKSAHAQRAQERDPEGERARVRAAVKRHYDGNKKLILEKKKRYYEQNAERIKANEKARRDAKKAAKAATDTGTP
jgi:uncharacterized Zn finger protein (UPF0148 family)